MSGLPPFRLRQALRSGGSACAGLPSLRDTGLRAGAAGQWPKVTHLQGWAGLGTAHGEEDFTRHLASQ